PVHGAREDRLEGLGIARLAAARLSARIAPELVGPVLGHARVIVPEMMLALHALDGGALAVPDSGDVEQGVGPEGALLGLVRLEEVELGRAEHLLPGLVAP